MAATRRLDLHIDRVTALVRTDRSAIQSVQLTSSVSLPNSVPGSPTASHPQQHLASQNTIRPAHMSPPEIDQPRMERVTVRTCHGCHAPIDAYHKGFSTGANLCPLEHWDGCHGGIAGGRDSSGKEWRSCVLDGDTGETSTDADEVSEGEGNEFHDTFDDNHLLDKAAGGDAAVSSEQHQVVLTPDGQHQFSPKPEQKDSHEISDQVVTMVDLGSDSDEDRVLRDLEAANNLLKSQLAKQEQERAAQMKQERARKIQMLQAENARLSAGMGGDTGGGKPKHPQQSLSARSGTLHPRTSKVARPTGWQPAFQEHLTRNQSRAAQYRPEEAPLYTGINMNGIRKIPVIGTQVDNLVGQIQTQAPSLDRRPSATLGQQLPPPRIKKKVVDQQSERVVGDVDTIEEDFVFSRRPDGSLVKIRVVNEAVGQPLANSRRRVAHIQPDHESDHDTSSDEDCDDIPRPGYCFRWKRDNLGEKYNVEEPACNRSPEMIYRYVRDKATGRSYKQLVPVATPKVTSRHSVPVTVSTRSGGPRTPLSATTQRNERMAAFVVPNEEKQGKSSIPDIVQYARSCPIAWTSKVTSDKLNMGLWCWSYMAELLAYRTGQTPSLLPGELESRMQHFLNVLEIALQPSNPAEFDGHSWRVARLYAEKVQQKIDRGETWTNFELRYGADSQPHELMAAKEEVKPVKKPREPREPQKEDSKGKTKDDSKWAKRSCTTWNTSSVEGKCDWEVQNDDRSCDRRHECSWCKEKGKKSLHHQRSFCRQRIAAGDQ